MAQVSDPSTFRYRHLQVDHLQLHLVEAGSPEHPAIVFLHGWPESWITFAGVMDRLRGDAPVIALDLPGVGGSPTPAPAHDKRTLAAIVRRTIEALELSRVTLVGHDIGGQIVYAGLRDRPAAQVRAVIMNVAVPGIDPWTEVTRNPHIWHFGFHAVPDLPEQLVSGRQTVYFDFFYDRLSAAPDGVSRAQRAAYADAYARPDARHAGFEWYRAFQRDEQDNASDRGQPVDIPVLYLRGEKEPGIDLTRYVTGLREAGPRRVRGDVIPGSGHFAPDERPDDVAAALRTFIADG